MRYECRDRTSYRYKQQYNSAKEALEHAGWYQNEDGTWNEQGDCDGKGFTTTEALALCKIEIMNVEEEDTNYKIMKYFQKEGKAAQVVEEGVTKAYAKRICSDPESSGPGWFYGWTTM